LTVTLRWIFEVYHKLIPSEYVVLLATFVAIQVVGINGGIIFGVIVAVVEFVVSTSRLSSLRRVSKQSRAVRQPHHRKLLQEVGYDSRQPQIVTLEIRETIFFGSSLALLSKICDEISISASPTDMIEMSLASPRHFSKSPSSPTATSLISNLKKKRKMGEEMTQAAVREKKKRPKFLILDLSEVPNVDASAARSCFLQLAKMCSKNGITMIATGANARVDWVLRSHDATYSSADEAIVKRELLYPHRQIESNRTRSGKVLLFDSLDSALQHCENKLLFDLDHRNKSMAHIAPSSYIIPHSAMESGHMVKTKLSAIFSRILGLGNDKEKQITRSFQASGFAQVQELKFCCGDNVYTKNEHADSFYVVLAGCVDICRDPIEGNESKYPSNSGRRFAMDDSNHGFGDVVSYLQAGGIFGYIDFSLGRRRNFNAVVSNDGTILAKITNELLLRLESEDPDLHRIVEKVLLHSSLMELANFDVA
jgi:CRP-like cAMP-binding protein